MKDKDLIIIKKAFWKTFYQSGEQWFPYNAPKEEMENAVDFVWKEFCEVISNVIEEDEE